MQVVRGDTCSIWHLKMTGFYFAKRNAHAGVSSAAFLTAAKEMMTGRRPDCISTYQSAGAYRSVSRMPA